MIFSPIPDQTIDIDSPEAQAGESDSFEVDFEGSGSGDGSFYDMEEDCEDVVCQSGGICDEDLYGTAHCRCQLGTQGRHCEDCKLTDFLIF